MFSGHVHIQKNDFFFYEIQKLSQTFLPLNNFVVGLFFHKC